MLVIQRNVIQLTTTQGLGTFQFLLESVLQPGRFQGSEKVLSKGTSGDAAMWHSYRKTDSQDRKCVEKTSCSMDKSMVSCSFFPQSLNDQKCWKNLENVFQDLGMSWDTNGAVSALVSLVAAVRFSAHPNTILFERTLW